MYFYCYKDFIVNLAVVPILRYRGRCQKRFSKSIVENRNLCNKSATIPKLRALFCYFLKACAITSGPVGEKTRPVSQFLSLSIQIKTNKLVRKDLGTSQTEDFGIIYFSGEGVHLRKTKFYLL